MYGRIGTILDSSIFEDRYQNIFLALIFT